MTDAEAARYGLVPCKRKPRYVFEDGRPMPRCDCGACAYARGAGKRVPHRRCHCARVRK